MGGSTAGTSGAVLTTNPKQAGSAVTILASAIYHGGSRLESIPGLVRQVLTDDLWRSYALPGGGPLAHYDDFGSFIDDGLHTTVDTLRDLCRRDAVALTLLGAAATYIDLKVKFGLNFFPGAGLTSLCLPHALTNLFHHFRVAQNLEGLRN